jgi:hypothetical protein
MRAIKVITFIFVWMLLTIVVHDLSILLEQNIQIDKLEIQQMEQSNEA